MSVLFPWNEGIDRLEADLILVDLLAITQDQYAFVNQTRKLADIKNPHINSVENYDSRRFNDQSRKVKNLGQKP